MLQSAHGLVMWQGKGCIMYEIFFVNFWLIILPGLRTLKPKNQKTYSRKPKLFSSSGSPAIELTRFHIRRCVTLSFDPTMTLKTISAMPTHMVTISADVSLRSLH